jgi:signal transduction histidine kinase
MSEAVDEELADLGELAGPLAHEFNNLLNNLLLNLAVLEADLPPRAAADVAEIRRQSARVARLVQQFQMLRRRRLDLGRQIDLASMMTDLAAAVAREGHDPVHGLPFAPIAVDLPAGLPPVSSSPTDLRRLVLFLLRNAARHAAAVGVGVSATAADGRVRLRIDDPGPPLTDEQLLHTFDPYGDARPGTYGLELAACQSLARRLRGKLTAEHRPGGGAVYVLDLPAGGRPPGELLS